MGMSASQARLLSLTSRVTDNEFRAQTITNSKMRLATESAEASKKYMNALNSKQLMYGVYDDNGDKTYTALTANVLLGYGDLKNQYNIVNSSGQILLNGTDIRNYMESRTLDDFLEKYGVEKSENPKYSQYLEDIFGSDYKQYYDENNKYKYIKKDNSDYLDYIIKLREDIKDIDIETIKKDDYNAKKVDFEKSLDDAGIKRTDKNSNTIFNQYVDILSAMPDYGPDFSSLALNYIYADSTCYNAVNDDTQYGIARIGHMEHNLAALIWGENGFAVNNKISNSENTITIKAKDNVNSGSASLTYYSNVSSNDQSIKLAGALNDYSEYNFVNKLKQDIIDLYCDVINFLLSDTNGYSSLESGSSTKLNLNRCEITRNDATCSYSMQDLLNRWEDVYTDLQNLDNLSDASRNKQFESWTNQADSAITEFETYIDNIPNKEISDETDARYQWYKNLWERMGGGAKTANGQKVDTSNFVELDENLINNSEWLEFALEHGVVTLEQAQFNENGSINYPNMGQYDWVSIQHTNASDIISKDDEKAIAIAEVKYKNAVNEIQKKDKKYDQDLKKLDTEHSALLTEYDSIKEIISKNAERSFKAFS